VPTLGRLAVAGLVSALAACGGRFTEDSPGDGGATVDAAVDGDGAAVDATPDLTACTGPGQCVLVPTGCCAACTRPTLDNQRAVRAERRALDRSLTCGPTPPTCPTCPSVVYDGSIQAVCRSPDGAAPPRCVAIDVRTEPLSACKTDDDCMLRTAGCCAECAPSGFRPPHENVIALARDARLAYQALVCRDGETCGLDCEYRHPAIHAVCDRETNHCRITL
jgi:hypothetical protein